MDQSLRDLIWQRAQSICEYCQIPQDCDELTFEVEHIIARKHQGPTTPDNLALACYRCNAYKGPNIAGIDAVTGATTPLFHPRRDDWNEHFQWNGPELLGRSSIGRATIAVLRINHPDRIRLRRQLVEEGVFPPREVSEAD